MKTKQPNATHTAFLKVWSSIGHTPITNRRGPYCDLLVDTTVEVVGPGEARDALTKLIEATPHANDGHFDVPSHPNQNTRTGWVTPRVGFVTA